MNYSAFFFQTVTQITTTSTILVLHIIDTTVSFFYPFLPVESSFPRNLGLILLRVGHIVIYGLQNRFFHFVLCTCRVGWGRLSKIIIIERVCWMLEASSKTRANNNNICSFTTEAGMDPKESFEGRLGVWNDPIKWNGAWDKIEDRDTCK